jgi:hypothetical protein
MQSQVRRKISKVGTKIKLSSLQQRLQQRLRTCHEKPMNETYTEMCVDYERGVC